MAAQTVLVTKLTGQAWIRGSDGSLTVIREGMRIPADAEIITASGSSVQLQADGQPPLVVGENQDVSLTADLVQPPLAQDAAVANPGNAEIDQIIAAINNGQDPFDNLDPTAAGLTGGSEGGSSFVRLSSIIESVSPLGLEYPRGSFGEQPERISFGVGREAQEPPTPEPVVQRDGTITLSSAASVTEGQAIVITATVDKAPQGSNLVLTLSGGHTLTILDGQTSGSVSVPTRADDAYVQGNQTQSFSITAATGGNYENLNTTSSTQTVVQDDDDTSTVTLSSAASVTEGQAIVITATVDKAPQGSNLVL
ncbi:hypothetical protein DZC30_22255, partial [Comamonas testosteroni]